MAKPIAVDENNFDKIVGESKIPVLVDFWASWCPPCQVIGPILEELATEYSGKLNFAKLNVDKVPMIPPRYGIHSIPTLLIFKGGKPLKQIVGLKNKAELKRFIETALA